MFWACLGPVVVVGRSEMWLMVCRGLFGVVGGYVHVFMDAVDAIYAVKCPLLSVTFAHFAPFWTILDHFGPFLAMLEARSG